MERMVATHRNVHLLDVQYRMNDSIMAFSNSEFYEGKLNSFVANANHLLFESDLPVEFIDTAGTGWNEETGEGSTSLKNTGEAELVFKHYSQLKEIISVGFRTAIISPYRGQVSEMEKHFAFEENVKLNTVDAFQGQEADVVYISLVRSNENGEIGFLKDYRRMNVAMTRAKKKLVVIGDSSTIGNDPFYGRFLSWVEQAQAYQSAWTWMS
jgi:superfamily I DNA and/or RNA helicase